MHPVHVRYETELPSFMKPVKTYRKITDTFRAKGIHVFTLNSIFIWHILFFNLYILN